MCDILKTLVNELHHYSHSQSLDTVPGKYAEDKVLCLCKYCLYSYDVYGDRHYFERFAETALYTNFVSTFGASWVTLLAPLDVHSYSDKVRICLQHEGLRATMEQQINELIVGCSVIGRKSLDKSRHYCRRAFKLYQQESYLKALDYVNKGLLWAPISDDVEDEDGKDALSLAFGCRSHVYAQLGLFYESFLDKRDAHKFAFSTEMKKSLTESLERMQNQLISAFGPSVLIGLDLPPFDPYDVSLDSFNPEIDGAVGSLYIDNDPHKGRTIKTQETLKTLDNVLIEEPYAVWLIPEFYSKYCAHCLKSIESRSIPCKGCIYLRYCSIDCCEENWKLCHSIECHFMATFKDFSIGFLALKIVLITGIDDALREYKSRMRNECIRYTFRASIKNRFADILTLLGREDRNNHLLAPTICCAAYLSLLVKGMNLINDEDLIDFGGLLLKLCMIIDSNGLPISNDLQESPISDKPKNFNDSVIGIGLYATASLLNHSCLHNCEPLFIGSKLRLTTNRNIRQDEELTISYGCSAVTLNYLKRQRWLLEKALFRCYCAICKLQI